MLAEPVGRTRIAAERTPVAGLEPLCIGRCQIICENREHAQYSTCESLFFLFPRYFLFFLFSLYLIIYLSIYLSVFSFSFARLSNSFFHRAGLPLRFFGIPFLGTYRKVCNSFEERCQISLAITEII